MPNAQLVTGYFHAAYTIAAAVYIGYILSLSARARRARKRASGTSAT
jgi:hypothetical protein